MRGGERGGEGLSVATVAAAIMIAEQVAGKATRDAYFLSQFPATDLPKAMVVAACLSILGSLVYARMLARWSPPRLVPATFAVSAALFVGEWLLVGVAPRAVAVALYLHMAVVGLLVISGFWALVNEAFDPHSARAGISRILTGATLGGVLGGIITDRVTAALGLDAMLVVLGAMHLLCAALLPWLGASDPGVATERGSPTLGLRVIRDTPYLRQMAILVALASMTAAILDYVLKATAAATFSDSDSLVSFFAAFYTVTGLATLVVQRGFSQAALRRFGLGAAMAVVPATLLAMSVLGTVAVRLWSVVALRATESVLGNAFLRPGLELLYTPLPPERKRSTKTIIDVACQRLGDLAGGGLVLLVLAFAAGRTEVLLLLLVSLAAAASLLVVRRLHRGYIEQLGESLRRGVVTLDDDDVLDRTTAHTLAATRAGVDRDELLAQIRRYRDRQIELGSKGWLKPEAAPAPPTPERRATAESVSWLLSDDCAAAARALARRPVDPRLVPFALMHLGDAELFPQARDALLEVADRSVGQLVDALVDESLPVLVRRQVPALLERAAGPRARDGLLLSLHAAPFEVRYRAAQSLSRLVNETAELGPDPTEVWALVRSELEVSREEWAAHQTVDTDDTSSFLDDTLRRRVDRGLEHVFTLQSLALDPDLLRLSLRALMSADPALRGTALEYLENVVPEPVRPLLWARLDAALPALTRRRSREEIEADLLRTGAAG
jgi:ATP:ADP antiporter, AAA family